MEVIVRVEEFLVVVFFFRIYFILEFVKYCFLGRGG